MTSSIVLILANTSPHRSSNLKYWQQSASIAAIESATDLQTCKIIRQACTSSAATCLERCNKMIRSNAVWWCVCSHLSLCLSLNVSVCKRPNFWKSWPRKFISTASKYIFIISRQVRIPRSSGNRQGHRRTKTAESHPAAPFCDRHGAVCSDGKSISVIQSMTLPTCSHARRRERTCADFILLIRSRPAGCADFKFPIRRQAVPCNDTACLYSARVWSAFDWKAILCKI